MAQIIARLGQGYGNPQQAMQILTTMRDTAAGLGQTAQGYYTQANVTIYRLGNDYLTVASNGKILSFVKDAGPGRVVETYLKLGGK